MRLTSLVLLLLSFAVITSSIVLSVYLAQKNHIPEEATVLPYVFYVREQIGVDVGTDKFRLGSLQPGTSSYRTFSINDALLAVTGTEVRYVRVEARGEGSEWLRIDPASTVLPAEIKVTAAVPPDARHGTYEGVLIITPYADELGTRAVKS